MKSNKLRISILPLVLLTGLSLATLQPPQKENGNKGETSQGKGNQNRKDNQDRNERPSGNSKQGNSHTQKRGNNGNKQPGKGNPDKQKKDRSNDRSDSFDKNKGRENNGVNGSYRGNNGEKGNGSGKFRKETVKWEKDENIVWGFENYSSRKRPKDFKKVTICHNTGDSEYPVNISVSENALKAHLAHGDQVGNCAVNYSDRWPANFIKTRENVYNSYEDTWETMSYSESLLRYAAERLLGVKSSFQAQRSGLSSTEVQRKEALILELQNNVNSLERQLATSRQRTEGININFNL